MIASNVVDLEFEFRSGQTMVSPWYSWKIGVKQLSLTHWLLHITFIKTILSNSPLFINNIILSLIYVCYIIIKIIIISKGYRVRDLVEVVFTIHTQPLLHHYNLIQFYLRWTVWRLPPVDRWFSLGNLFICSRSVVCSSYFGYLQ